MPLSLSNNLIAKKNALAVPDAWLLLLGITIPGVSPFYLVNNNENIVFGGNTYQAASFFITLPQKSSDGKIPTVKLEVSNINQTLTYYMEEYAGGVGATVDLTVVNSGLLSEDYTELEMTFDVMAASMNAQSVSFDLGAPNPLSSRFPLYRYIASRCKWVLNYKGVECAYSGALATCAGTLADCRTHGNSVRFGGFPGMTSGGVRLA